jgi:hypothetical protein
MRNGDVDEGERLRGLLHGARGVGTVIPVLGAAANALLEAGEALESIALDLSKIGSDTARAISDTVAMKQHIANATAREQGMRRDLDATQDAVRQLKAQLGRSGKKPKPKTKLKAKRRKGRL